jgi:hypothetical protein
MSGDFLFTVDEARDAAARLRPSPRRGAGNQRLRSAQVDDVRARLDAGETAASIAQRHGVTRQRIGAIRAEQNTEREIANELATTRIDLLAAIAEGRCTPHIGNALLLAIAADPIEYIKYAREQR